MLKFLYSIGMGILTGVIASVAFQTINYLSKPKIKISNEISKKKNKDTGEIEYRFKIVNMSKHYVKNVKVFLEVVTRDNGNGGVILSTKPIQVLRKDVTFIEPHNKNDADASYAIRYRIDGDLEKLWLDDTTSFLRLRFYCESEFNGTGKLFTQNYSKKSSIKEGEFNFGDSCEIA